MSLLGMPVETLDSDAVLARFNKLVHDLLRGTMTRNTFQPWEIEILWDIEACNLKGAVGRETLRRYQKAVQRAMEKGARSPVRLSEYLSNKKTAAAAKPSLGVDQKPLGGCLCTFPT
jgi:hypothetical protein